MSDDAKKESNAKDLEAAMAQIEKRYGKGAIIQLGETVVEPIEAYSTGSIGLDIALGIGGIPKGRICEVYGPESSGKTTLALHIAAEVQKKKGKVLFIDAEHALDVKYAKQLGVNTAELLVSQPDCGEQALEIAETMITSGTVDLIIIDSVAALTPRAEIDGEMEDQQPGLQARLMSKAMRKLTALSAKANCTIIFINQIRMKIGVMFGSPETTAGGNALKFYCSVRMDIRRIGSIKDNNDVTGNRVRVKVVKNKVAAPFREAEFDLIFNEGISQAGELLDIGSEQGVIDKAGSWYAFKGERMGQGREGSKAFLKEHPEVKAEIRSLILSTMGIEKTAEASTDKKTAKTEKASLSKSIDAAVSPTAKAAKATAKNEDADINILQ